VSQAKGTWCFQIEVPQLYMPWDFHCPQVDGTFWEKITCGKSRKEKQEGIRISNRE
jgi:hypothetical protein